MRIVKQKHSLFHCFCAAFSVYSFYKKFMPMTEMKQRSKNAAMTVTRVNDHIIWLQSAVYSFYVVRGKKTALIELGISPVVPELLYSLEHDLDIRRVDFLISPHSHFDHFGGAPRLKKHFNAPVVASEETLKIFTPGMLETYRNTMKKLAQNPFYRLAFPRGDAVVDFDEIPIEIFAREGLVLLLGGKELAFYETPGHSDCSVSILCKDCGTLFISDAAGAPFPSGKFWPTAYASRAQYENSIRKMQKLKPSAIGLGHTGCVTGSEGSAFLDRSLRETDKFFTHLQELKKNNADEDIHKILFKEFEGNLKAYIQPGIFKWGNREMLKQLHAM